MAVAKPPHKPIDQGPPGPGVTAQVAIGRSDPLPRYRFEDVFARGGVALSRTLYRCVRCTARLLEPFRQLIVARVHRSHVFTRTTRP
jgi:transposase